jgi:hypothetical protein
VQNVCSVRAAWLVDCRSTYAPDLATAEMDPAAEGAISHRGRALRALAPVIA